MKTLMIMRHGDAGWNTGVASDLERPLSNRGKEEVSLIAQFLQTCAFVPELILSSPALRAQQTTEELIQLLGKPPLLTFDQQLYGATVGILLERLSRLPEPYGQVLLVGHNPSLEELICFLCALHRTKALQLPPAGLVCLTCDLPSWAALESHQQATLRWFVIPALLSKLF